jgi:hypothetical protein
VSKIRFVGLMASTEQTHHELVKQPHDPLPEGESPDRNNRIFRNHDHSSRRGVE